MIKTTTIFLLLLFHLCSFSQELSRRPLLGIAYETASQKVINDLPTGVEVKFIVPQSSAQKAGLEVGDIIIQYEDIAIQGKSDFKTQMRNKKTGEKIKLKIIRKGKVMNKKMVLTAFPKEENPNFQTLYDEVGINNNRIRTLITKPHGNDKSFPAVMIIQGIGCGSMEKPFKNKGGIHHLVDSLTQAGFVTMRMERSGVGDSQGIPCNTLDFKEDFENFKAGFKKMKTYDFVDKEKLFLVGISMGGLMAPMISNEIDLAGILVYGTGGKDWYTYELENTLRQLILEDTPMDQLTELMKWEQKRLHYFFIEKKTPDEIKLINKKIGEQCEAYPLHYSYFQQVADVDIYNVWANCKAKNVVAIHGSADFVSGAAEHELIAFIANQNENVKAEYVEFKESDHWMLKAKTEKASLTKKVEGINFELISFMKNWLAIKMQ